MGRPDPAKLWSKAIALEEQARDLRRRALELAIDRCHGILQYVADAIGVPRSNIRVLFRGRYADLEQRARKLRERSGYTTGNVPKDLRPDGDE